MMMFPNVIYNSSAHHANLLSVGAVAPGSSSSSSQLNYYHNASGNGKGVSGRDIVPTELTQQKQRRRNESKVKTSHHHHQKKHNSTSKFLPLINSNNNNNAKTFNDTINSSHSHMNTLKLPSILQQQQPIQSTTANILPFINNSNNTNSNQNTQLYTNGINGGDSLKSLISSYMTLNPSTAAAAYAAAAAALSQTNSYFWNSVNVSFNQYNNSNSNNQFSQRYSNSFMPNLSANGKTETRSNFIVDKVKIIYIF
jgi:hypothetical protein